MLNNKKGVTLASLTIYIIVVIVVLGTLTFMNINVISKMNDLSNKTTVTNEYCKFMSFFIKDIKSSEGVVEYNSNMILLSNGVKYSIESTNDMYAGCGIYRNSVLISEELYRKAGEHPYFAYDNDTNTITINFIYSSHTINNSFHFEQSFLVGRGY